MPASALLHRPDFPFLHRSRNTHDDGVIRHRLQHHRVGTDLGIVSHPDQYIIFLQTSLSRRGIRHNLSQKNLTEALHISVTAQPLDPATATHSHLGMEGDIDYFIDPETRIPVEMRAHIKLVGAVPLRLKKVVLTD